MPTIDKSVYESRPTILDVNGAVSRYNDILKLNRTRTGTELPNWKRRIAGKESATTNLSAVMETAYASPGLQHIKEKTGFKRYYLATDCAMSWNTASPVSVGSGSTAKALATAIGGFNKKVSELNTPLQGQVFLAELHKTIQMLRNPFKAGQALLYDFFLYKKRRTGRNAAQAIGKTWLEVRFGLLPLISDIDGIMKILITQSQKEEVQTHRVYGVGESSTIEARSGSTIAGMQLYGTTQRKVKVEHIIRFGFSQAHMDADGLRYQHFRNSFLNIRDVLNTAWELVPFSFLVDYFLNVGLIIQSATAGQQGVIWTSQSTITSITCTCSADTFVVGRDYDLVAFNPCIVSRTRRTVERTTAPIGIPPLVFSLPGSDVQLLNIAALLSGYFKRS